MKIKITICIFLMSLSALCAVGQETVFALLKNDLRLADKYFEAKDYQSALELYNVVARKRPSREVDLKIARSHHFLKQYKKAVSIYEKHEKSTSLPASDLYYYAESQSGILQYGKAVETYKRYLSLAPDDELVMKKIWRLSNLQYLFEDSSHFAVRIVDLNTEYGELGAVPYKNGVVFISNRKEVQAIEKIDAATHAPFYRTYFSQVTLDTGSMGARYGKPSTFNKDLSTKFHAGTLTFYDDERKMVFASVGEKPGPGGARTMQLYFAENKDGQWKLTFAFPYNNGSYSICNPTISDDGNVLYFSSDMKGGFGGKDIYKSEFVNGQWTKPVNLGENVNTAYDEVFPFLHNHILYFASNGHPGLGGLDIFRAPEVAGNFMDAENMGYPLNTNYDDFGLVIDSTNIHGYLSSNRANGGYNDDIYAFEMDLQSYPMTISGVMKFKEHSWSDELITMSGAKLYLVDNNRDVVVQETVCNQDGIFSLIIPYYSKFKIKVVSADGEENIVSLEIPKHQQEQGEHEIVVVKDAFNETNLKSEGK